MIYQGEDYPEICSECRAAINACATAVQVGPDIDDEEGPLNLAGDLRLLCGGNTCDKRADPNYLALADFIMHG